MKKYYSIIIALLCLSTLQAQHESAARVLIEEDYKSLLTGINDLKSEIKNTKDQAVLSELKAALNGIIADYTAGPYSIFDDGAIVDDGVVGTTGKRSKQKVKSFLINYSGRSYPRVDISLIMVNNTSTPGVIEAIYESVGEVGTSGVERKALITTDNGILKIRRISYTDDEVVAQVEKTTKSQDTPIQKPIAVVEKEVIVPRINMSNQISYDTNGIQIHGSIDDSYADGTLAAYWNGNFVPGLRLNLTSHTYELMIKEVVNNPISGELLLRYEYDKKKYIERRKNIVLLPKAQSYSHLDSYKSETENAVGDSGHE